MIRISRLLLTLPLAAGGRAAGAQSVFDSELRLAPQMIQYQLKAPANETISELVVPAFVSIPMGASFTVDVGTAYARARSTTPTSVSEVSGLTDTQVRGTLSLGNDFVVITGGLNLPTGRSTVTPQQVTAAGRIGSDFLAFPITSMGTGFGATAGIAVARPAGEWNIGMGGAVRLSQAYEPFDAQGQPPLRFQPGNEYRARIGADRPWRAGRLALGLTYSAFGNDNANGFTSNTGNRTIAQIVATNLIGTTEYTVAAYDVFRGAGRYVTQEPSGRENIANLYLGLGLHTLSTVIEPSVELRHWQQDIPASPTTGAAGGRSLSSYLGTVGLRTRIPLAGLAAFPSVGYTMGSLARIDPTDPSASSGVAGWRAQLALRVGP